MTDQELKRFWNQFILQPTKTLFLVMCLLWFLVASAWVCLPVLILYHLLIIAKALQFQHHSFLCFPGTPALTSRGFVEEDFEKVAEFFDEAVKLALKIKGDTKGSLRCHLLLGVIIFIIFVGFTNHLVYYLLFRNKVEGFCSNFDVR